MRSAIYSYIQESTASIIEDAINNNTVKIRIVPIRPSEHKLSPLDQYKVVMNQHTVFTADSHSACLLEASKIVENNHEKTDDTHSKLSASIPKAFIIGLSQMQEYVQQGYAALAEIISMSDMDDNTILQHIEQQYAHANSVLIVSDSENSRYLIKPHKSTRLLTFGVDCDLSEEGCMPTIAFSKNIEAYSRTALHRQIENEIKSKLGEDIDLTNLRTKVYDEPF